MLHDFHFGYGGWGDPALCDFGFQLLVEGVNRQAGMLPEGFGGQFAFVLAEEGGQRGFGVGLVLFAKGESETSSVLGAFIFFQVFPVGWCR